MPNEKSASVLKPGATHALPGILSRHLLLQTKLWHEAIRAALPEKLHAVDLDAFAMGRAG